LTEDDRLAALWLRETGCYAVAVMHYDATGAYRLKITNSAYNEAAEAFWCYDRAQAAVLYNHMRSVMHIRGYRYHRTIDDLIEMAFKITRAPCRPIRHDRMMISARKAVAGAIEAADSGRGHAGDKYGDKWGQSRLRKKLLKKMVIFSAKDFRRHAFDIVDQMY
jgi:hypothetical protein